MIQSEFRAIKPKNCVIQTFTNLKVKVQRKKSKQTVLFHYQFQLAKH